MESGIESSPTVPPGGSNCILVVEDEFLVRMFVSDVLRDADYRVVEACDAEEAVTILESGVPVDLVLTDVRMPGPIDGMGLLALVRAANPRLPMILTSGHLQRDSSFPDHFTEFLPKPYKPDHLLQLVRRQLERIE